MVLSSRTAAAKVASLGLLDYLRGADLPPAVQQRPTRTRRDKPRARIVLPANSCGLSPVRLLRLRRGLAPRQRIRWYCTLEPRSRSGHAHAARSAARVPSSAKQRRQSARAVPPDSLHQRLRRSAANCAQLDGSRTMKGLLSVNRARPLRAWRKALQRVLQARPIPLSTASETVAQVSL